MPPAKFYTVSGKSTPHELPLAVADKDLFITVFGEKAKVEKIVEKIQNLQFVSPIEELQNFLRKEASATEVLIVKVKNNVLYAGGVGQMHLYLKRNGEIHPLFEPSEKEKTMSGQIQDNDVFMMFSSPAKDLIDDVSKNENLEKMAEKLNEKTLLSKNHQKICSVIFSFPQEEVVEKAVVVEEQKEEEKAEEPKEQEELKEQKDNILKKINIQIAKLIGGAIILIIVVIFLINIINKITGAAKAKIQEETKKIEEIQNNLTSAKELLDLNNVRAEEIANQVLSEIKKINVGRLASNDNKNKISALTRELNDLLPKTSSIKKTKATLVYSTSTLKKNSTISDFVMQNNQVYILDSSQNFVYSVNLSTKKSETFDLAKYVKSPKFIILSDTNVFVFAADAIMQISTDTKKAKTTFKSDVKWQKITGMASYFGNLYLLDAAGGQVWKYVKNDSGFSLIQPYLTAKTDLSKAISLGIDTSVYVLFNNGSLNTYLKGEKQVFALGKIPNQALKNPTKILVSPDLKNIYILEPSQKRIIVFDGAGKYLQRIVDNKLEVAKNFGVSEKDKTIFFSVGSDIYKITF